MMNIVYNENVITKIIDFELFYIVQIFKNKYHFRTYWNIKFEFFFWTLVPEFKIRQRHLE